MVRSVEATRREGSAVDLEVTAVRYWPLEPMAGLLTLEDPATQGLELRLPNSPALGGGMAVETRSAVLRLRMPDPATVRMTLWPGVEWVPAADGLDDGILVGPEGSAALAGADYPAGEDDLAPADDPAGAAAGALGCGFDLAVDEASVTLTSAEVTLVLARRPFAWSLADRNGRVLARSGGDRRQVAGFPLAPALAFGDGRAWCALELRPNEAVVGFGEQFGPVLRNGGRIELVADDALGAGTGKAYKAAPIFHSSAGYSGFLHSPGPVTADVGARNPAVLSLEAEEERLDLFVLGAPSPKERLSALTALTGRCAVPPRWALGVWMSRCRYRDRSELLAAALGMRAHQVPCDVMHLDPDWLERDLLNCDFDWSEAKLGDAGDLVEILARNGFNLSLWELPYLDPDSPRHAEAVQLGYLVRGAGGAGLAAARVFARDGRPRALVDFSNPDARRWWKDLHAKYLDLGVAAFTTDFGEGLPDDAVMSDGRNGRAWRNLYPLWYNRTVAEAINEHAAQVGPLAQVRPLEQVGPPQAEPAQGGTPQAGAAQVRPSGGLVWGRSGWAGSQRYPAQWGGDPESSVAGMAATLRAGLSWSLSAPGLWGHDIGGFYGAGPSPELYVRWAQWGCLSPLSRFHGLGPREPWEFGDRALGIVRGFAQLRYRLLPYLMSAAGEAARFGWPVMRPMCLEYPDDLALWQVESQYLLGSDLLVVPVLDDSPHPVSVRCVLPPGWWIDFWSGEAHQGPAVVSVTVALERLPLFVRAGAVVPMGPVVEGSTEHIPIGDWTMHCWSVPGEPAAQGVVYDGENELRYYLEPGQTLRCVEPVRRAVAAVAHLPGGAESALAIRR